MLAGWALFCIGVEREHALITGVGIIAVIVGAFSLQFSIATGTHQGSLDMQDFYMLVSVYLAFLYWYLFIKGNEDVTKGEVFSTLLAGIVAVVMYRYISFWRGVTLGMIVLGSIIARVVQRLLG